MTDFAGTTIRLLAGMSVVISVPIDATTGAGLFAKQGEVTFKDGKRSLIRGFLSEDENVGIVEPTEREAAEVRYKHKKAEKNSVWFFAHNGDTAVCNIVATPIHDHSSIVQGGPAYGTYFNDDEIEDGGEIPEGEEG